MVGELSATQALAESQAQVDWIARLRLHRAHYWRQRSDRQAAIDEARRALEDAGALGNDRLAWEAGVLLLGLYRSVNDSEGAERLFAHLKSLVERLDDVRKDVQLVLQELSELYIEQPKAALTGAQAVLIQAEAIGDPALEADCWALIAEVSRRSNDLPAALMAFRQQLALLRQVGDRHSEGQTLNALGLALIGLGQLSEANAHLQQAYTILRPLGERRGEALSLCYMGVIASMRTAFDESSAYLTRGLTLLRQLSVPGDLGLALFFLGNVEIRRANLPAAQTAFREALTRFETMDLHVQAAEVSMALAHWSLEYGDGNRARRFAARLLPDLERGQVNDLQFPGLAYWRAVRIAERTNQPEIARRLRLAFQTYYETIAARLDVQWQAAFAQQLWYHRELLGTGV